MKNIKIVVLALFASTFFSSCVRFVPMGQAGGIRPMWDQGQGQVQGERYLEGVNVTKDNLYYSGGVTATVGLVPARGSGVSPEKIKSVERDISQMASKKLNDSKGTLPNGEEYVPFAKKALSGMYDPDETFFVKLERKEKPVTTKSQTVFVPESKVSGEIKQMFPVN